MNNHNETLAEMIGIILGDGNLSKNGYYLTITLNNIDEPKYVEYVRSLMVKLFKEIPKKINLPNNKAIQLRICNRSLVNLLIIKGLKKGNKVKNQVGVPLWILKDQQNIIACLRGLIDTDGSIFPVIREKAIKINFKNNSKPLVKYFKYMCESIGIKMANVIEGWTHNRGKQFKYYKVHIGGKEQVAQFLYLVKPMKWKFKWRALNNEFKRNDSSLLDAFHYKRADKSGVYTKKLIETINFE